MNATGGNMTGNATCLPPVYMKATSNGAWAGDNPLAFSLLLLIVQLCLILFFSRAFFLFLRPLRQPRVIAEILGGIVLGTSVMGRIPGFTATIFPPKSITVLTTVANLGLLYFLFLVGLELDLRSISKIGLQALWVSLAGIALPFTMGIGSSFAIRALLGVYSAFGPFLVFMGVAMSITAFPVLARILAERKLLTTDVGQIAMSVAAVDDVCAWILLALALALTTPNASPVIVVWILLCGVAFVLIMFFAVRPFMSYLVRSAGVISGNEPIPEWLVAITLVGVVISGFATDVIGIHAIFGAFIYGLCIPKDGPFASQILEKIEDFISVVMLPLYFASSGLAVNFEAISANGVAVMFIVIATACFGKIGGAFGASMLSGLTARKSLVLGILMNTKGLVELIVLNIGLQKKVINVELYTVMVIMALVTTFMTTPLVMIFYPPARQGHRYTKTLEEHEGQKEDGELRLLECIWGSQNVPGMLGLTEVFRGNAGKGKSKLRVFLMHLMEYSERSSAIRMVTRVRKDGKPYWSKEAERRGQDQVVVAFKAYADLSRVNVVPLTSISDYDNMHEDVCQTAEDRQTSLIVMPYYKIETPSGEEVINHNFQQVTHKLLRSAPCSVAILVDRGLGGAPGISLEKHVGVLFFGGPDDREALTLAKRMVQHPGVTVTVIHFLPSNEAAIGLEIEQQQQQQQLTQPRGEQQQQRADAIAASFAVSLDKTVIEAERKEDESALNEILEVFPEAASGRVAPTSEDGASLPRRKFTYEKRVVDDLLTALHGLTGDSFDLLILGRGRRPPLLLAGLAVNHTPLRSGFSWSSTVNPSQGASASGTSSLGPVGDILSNSEVQASLLVVQQHDEAMVRSKSAI